MTGSLVSAGVRTSSTSMLRSDAVVAGCWLLLAVTNHQ
jgi:hypothetical protein